MKNYNKSEQLINKVLTAVSDWFNENPTIKTVIGELQTKNGFIVKEIYFQDFFVRISVYVLNDTAASYSYNEVTGKDCLYFIYYLDKNRLQLMVTV